MDWKNIFKCINKYLLLICFAIVIIGLGLLNVISREKVFSEMENRYLQTKPIFNLKNFMSGSFSDKYEKFINDQFIFRNWWINIKMLSEFSLLKIENNGVIFGREGYMFDKCEVVDMNKLYRNVYSIINFSNKHSKKIFFTIVPNSYEILRDKLPIGVNNINQVAYIEDVLKQIDLKGKNIVFIDSNLILSKNKNDEIFYHTDHHWTTKGAYCFYDGISHDLNYLPIDIRSLKKSMVEDFYGTFYSRAKIFWAKPDKIFYYDADIDNMIINDKVYDDIYDLGKFNTKDKYASFLYGNNGFTIINTKYNPNKKNNIMIIKDSYANSFIPFLTYNYNKIFVVDLRYFNESLDKVILENDINEVFIMYNFMNFVADNNICKITK